VTVSVGIACFDDASACRENLSVEQGMRNSSQGLRASDLVQAADKALYSAKQAGRAQAKLRDIASADTSGLESDITT
jgi:PleD family two-component response regulator